MRFDLFQSFVVDGNSVWIVDGAVASSIFGLVSSKPKVSMIELTPLAGECPEFPHPSHDGEIRHRSR